MCFFLQEGDDDMATSSIFTSFDMKDKKTAEAFVEALDKSAHEPAWKPSKPVKPLLTDPEAIRVLFAKRKKNYE